MPQEASSLCRQEVAIASSEQLRALDPAPVRRCGTEGRTEQNRTVKGTRDGRGTYE